MQTIAAEIAITFADDMTAFIKGGSRIVVQLLMAPIERIANACDVAGVLPLNRPSFYGRQVETNRPRPGSNRGTARRRRRRGPWRSMFAFDLLSDLT